MNLDLSGKTALVCGSTQGIGRAAAQELALLGANIVLLARDEGRLAKVANELPKREGQTCLFFTADFSNPENAKAAAQQALAAAGTIHILINNTGGPAGGPIAEATADAFVAAFQQHLLCNHALAQILTPGMKAAGFGRIVNVVSTSVYEPIKGLGVSNTTRAAVAGWAKTLAFELAPFGVTVNNVLPGATQTQRLSNIIASKAEKSGQAEEQAAAEMLSHIPARRFGQSEEIGAAIAFLASPAAGYITGVSLAVDGGRMASI